MDGFKEFQGKNLDDAIREACEYFATSRERLEIDIVQDSKSGIFGLVGARKAKVRAKRVQLRTAVDDVLGRSQDSPAVPVPTAEPAPVIAPAIAPIVAPVVSPAPPQGAKAQAPPQGRPPRKREKNAHQETAPHRQAPQKARQEKRPPAPVPAPAPMPPIAMQSLTVTDDVPCDEEAEGLRLVPLESLDTERLCVLSQEVVARLVRPIVGDANVRVDIADGRVCAHVDSGDDSGLLIGREGQTLASLQYLASRMVSRGMNALVRVQLDAGAYRLRQDEKLREIAQVLAERVRATGRSQSTRPLSSYHRRIIHVLFQDDPQVQTRSSGDGPLKRVVVQRRKG